MIQENKASWISHHIHNIKSTAILPQCFLKSTINLIKLQSFHETSYATLVTIHGFINKCCNVYVCYIPRNIYSFFVVY